MSKDFWNCPDCGVKLSYKKLEEANEERKKKGVSIAAKFTRCKGTGYHIPGVAGRFYKLTKKGRRIGEIAEEALKKIEKVK